MANKLLSYTSRDFESIKKDLINAIPTLTNLWTNREESDPGMVLLTLMSALGDNLSYNMDRQSLEFFGQTVTQRKNAARVFDLVNYKMHWYKSAELDVTIYNNYDSQIALMFNPTADNSQRLVSSTINSAPSYFLLYPEETPSNWNDNKIISIPSQSSVTLKAIQGELNSISFPATSIDANNRYYLPVSKIDQSHMWLADDKNYQWYLVDSINELTETVPRFEFNVDEYNLPYIQFVPYWRTSFGESHNFTLYYLSTRGANGGVTANVLNLIPSLKRINGSTNSSFNDSIVIMHDSNVYNSANINNVPGRDPQTADEAYKDSRNYIGTYNTLVTLIDFENFMNRIGLISASKAVDGQYATEVNEKLLEMLKNKYRNVDGGSDKELHLYEANQLKFNDYTPSDVDGDGDVDTDDELAEHFGFKPYNLQMHMIAGNFQLMDRFNQTRLAVEEAIKVPTDPDVNDGYINYMLQDSVVGDSDDSTVSQSGINSYKLFTSDINYAPVRKFPFFVNGEIHLREPMRPAEANLVLYNVYAALVNRFSATNLTIGEKINFKDILDTINSADENVYYFDAGANSPTGSLIDYPKSDDFNYTSFNFDTLEYEPYGVNINPEYFNEVSMQAYADVVQNNNVLMYFCNTFSNRLSIAEDSILSKDNPPVINTKLNVDLKYIDTEPDDPANIQATLKVYTLNSDGTEGNLIIDGAKVFRYAVVKSVTVDCTNPDNPTYDIIPNTGIDEYNIKYFDMNKISTPDDAGDINDDISKWSKSNIINIGNNPNVNPKIKRTTVYKKILLNNIGTYSSVENLPGSGVNINDVAYVTDKNNYYRYNGVSWKLNIYGLYYYTQDNTFNGFIFAYAITETISTNESGKQFSSRITLLEPEA